MAKPPTGKAPMKPPLFAYRDPETLEEVLSLLEEHGSDASLLAGGQSLLPLLNLRLARPEVIIDLRRVAGLDGVEVDAQGVRLGAMVRARAVERSLRIREVAPALSDAVACIAHPQIRSRTTIGGNIAHADPSSELPGVMAAFEGRVELTSAKGSRWVPWSEYFITVFTTAREPEEFVTRVDFPLEAGMTYSFREIARRPGDYPLAAVCCGLAWDGDVISRARVAAVAVADRPVRLPDVEEALMGRSAKDPSVVREVRAIAAESTPAHDDGHGSARYRRSIVGTLLADIMSAQVVAA